MNIMPLITLDLTPASLACLIDVVEEARAVALIHSTGPMALREAAALEGIWHMMHPPYDIREDDQTSLTLSQVCFLVDYLGDYHGDYVNGLEGLLMEFQKILKEQANRH